MADTLRVEKVAEDTVVKYEQKYSGDVYARIYKRFPPGDNTDRDKPCWAKRVIAKRRAISSKHKVDLPWESIFEGTDFTKEHAVHKDTDMETKVAIALHVASVEGYGDAWGYAYSQKMMDHLNHD